MIATFVAIIAGIATYLFASQITKSTKILKEDTMAVVIALQDIPESAIVTAEMVTVVQYTTVTVAPGAASKLEDVVGKFSRYPVSKGEQVIMNRLNEIGVEQNNAPLSYQLKDGEYAYSISVDAVQGISGFIGKGDYVDILLTGAVPSTPEEIAATGEKEKVATKILMSNVKVLRISDYSTNLSSEAANGPPITSYSLLTLLLDEEQILELTQQQIVGRITLALRPIAQSVEADGEQTTDQVVEQTSTPVN